MFTGQKRINVVSFRFSDNILLICIVSCLLAFDFKCMVLFNYVNSLQPCMHSFCASCYSEWMQKSGDCPTVSLLSGRLCLINGNWFLLHMNISCCCKHRLTTNNVRFLWSYAKHQTCNNKLWWANQLVMEWYNFVMSTHCSIQRITQIFGRLMLMNSLALRVTKFNRFILVSYFINDTSFYWRDKPCALRYICVFSVE